MSGSDGYDDATVDEIVARTGIDRELVIDAMLGADAQRKVIQQLMADFRYRFESES